MQPILIPSFTKLTTVTPDAFIKDALTYLQKSHASNRAVTWLKTVFCITKDPFKALDYSLQSVLLKELHYIIAAYTIESFIHQIIGQLQEVVSDKNPLPVTLIPYFTAYTTHQRFNCEIQRYLDIDSEFDRRQWTRGIDHTRVYDSIIYLEFPDLPGLSMTEQQRKMLQLPDVFRNVREVTLGNSSGFLERTIPARMLKKFKQLRVITVISCKVESIAHLREIASIPSVQTIACKKHGEEVTRKPRVVKHKDVIQQVFESECTLIHAFLRLSLGSS